jgi:hypothetical protein
MVWFHLEKPHRHAQQCALVISKAFLKPVQVTIKINHHGDFNTILSSRVRSSRQKINILLVGTWNPVQNSPCEDTNQGSIKFRNRKECHVKMCGRTHL